ncbi:MAG: hypothetical protein ACRD0D_01165 [Acidimicrobiales bacterium]
MDPPHPVEGGSANDYDYVEGDPVNQFDLDGQICWSCAAKKVGRAAKAVGKAAWEHRDQIAFGLAVVGTFACTVCTAAFYAGMAITAASTANSCARRDRGGCAGGVLSLATGGTGRFFQTSGRATILAGRSQIARRGVSNTLVRLEGRIQVASGRAEWGIGAGLGGVSTATSGYCANSRAC